MIWAVGPAIAVGILLVGWIAMSERTKRMSFNAVLALMRQNMELRRHIARLESPPARTWEDVVKRGYWR